MTARKEATTYRYIGAASDTKATNVPVGSTYFEWDTGDTYITDDGTNWRKKSGAYNNISVVRSIKTLDAAAIYAVGDVLSEDPSTDKGTTFDFLAVVGGNGGAGEITHAQCLTETNSASSPISLFLFTVSNPACELDDAASNTAPVYSDMTASKYIGRIGFEALTAMGTTGCAYAEATPYTASSGLPRSFVCASGDSSIFGVAVCETALGVAPSTDMMFTLTIEKR